MEHGLAQHDGAAPPGLARAIALLSRSELKARLSRRLEASSASRDERVERAAFVEA